MRVRYLDTSITTAKLTVSPERLVPPPRTRIGAPNSRQAACVATTSSSVLGTTTPIGTWRKLEESVAYSALLAASKRTSPSTVRSSRRLRWPTSTCVAPAIPPR